jgi:transmembrane protein TMEM174 (potassium channel)
MSKLQFQLRGREMNRIEAVSDVVFGFALALLVVSLEVPHTYADLLAAMRGFPAFAFTFAALMYVWVRHYYFFRYYGLDDLTTIVLNTVLLFLVLFYVYPLKFLFSVFLVNIWVNPLIGMPNQITAVHSGLDPVMTWGDVRGVFIIFGAGIAAIYFVFAALYWHAYRMREALVLSPFEIAYTKTSMVTQILNGGVGLLSILVASVFTLGHSGWAGYVYLLLLPMVALWRWRRRSLDERDQSPLALVPSGPALPATSEK